MACDCVDLANTCFECLEPGQKQSVICYLLVELLKKFDPMAEDTPEGVLNLASCWTCLMPGQLAAAGAYLLNEMYTYLSAAGMILHGHGTPENAQAAPVGWGYIDEDNPGHFYVKVSGTGNTGWALNS